MLPTSSAHASAELHRARRQLAHPRARVERVEPAVDEPVERHRRRARADRGDRDRAASAPAVIAGPGALKTPARMSGSENSVCSKRTNDA